MRLLVPVIAVHVAALAGCSSSEGGVTLPPVTGIVVPAESITRSRGCGAEPGRVFKYAAVVNAAGAADGGASGRGLARGVYDCFVDAIFTELGDAPVLTVSDIPAFTSRGIIVFYIENNKVRFEINAAAAQLRNIKVHSQLLARARVVGPRPGRGRL